MSLEDAIRELENADAAAEAEARAPGGWLFELEKSQREMDRQLDTYAREAADVLGTRDIPRRHLRDIGSPAGTPEAPPSPPAWEISLAPSRIRLALTPDGVFHIVYARAHHGLPADREWRPLKMVGQHRFAPWRHHFRLGLDPAGSLKVVAGSDDEPVLDFADQLVKDMYRHIATERGIGKF